MKLSETPKNFVKCGLCGWGFECIWTGLHSALKKGEKTCLCRTSLWMFPIYGMACLIQPMHQILKKKNILVRGIMYTICIFCAEYSTGKWLKKNHCCPWDYSDSKCNIEGVIRLDYAPLWFFVSLFYEHLVD